MSTQPNLRPALRPTSGSSLLAAYADGDRDASGPASSLHPRRRDTLGPRCRRRVGVARLQRLVAGNLGSPVAFDERAHGVVRWIFVALLDGTDQDPSEGLEFADRAVDVPHPLLEQRLDGGAYGSTGTMLAEDIGDVAEAEAEGSRSADEPEGADLVRGEQPVARGGAVYGDDQPLLLIDAHRLAGHTRSAGRLPGGQPGVGGH